MYLPILLALALVAGILIGTRLVNFTKRENKRINIPVLRNDKVMEVIQFIERDYVDSLSGDKIREDAIIGMLNGLDPHSQYISADELKEVNETLIGNFEGIGIEFRLVEDTINVLHVIPGGPSEKTGLRVGDRIVQINDTVVAGIKLTNRDVVKKLKGPRGTKVTVSIFRQGIAGLTDFTIIRDIIPLYSVDVSYMVNDSIGYIKLSKFSASTPQELDEAIEDLKGKGSNKLILDLRGNVGGYLESAIKLADEFLGEQKLIV
jgi:carboxyl-terminal processing protease